MAGIFARQLAILEFLRMLPAAFVSFSVSIGRGIKNGLGFSARKKSRETGV
jgi:hypothetical protein